MVLIGNFSVVVFTGHGDQDILDVGSREVPDRGEEVGHRFGSKSSGEGGSVCGGGGTTGAVVDCEFTRKILGPSVGK